MTHAVWHALATAVDWHLGRSEVNGIVITHGTDTLEETAYFLQRVLAPTKPVVLVAAMRPATSLQADGPQNLLDAVRVANTAGARGVVVALAGEVHSGLDVRKTHTSRLAAFGSGDAGAVAHIEHGRLRVHRAWPAGAALGLDSLPVDATQWPAVEIVTSHVGANPSVVDALRESGVRGIVVAATGNGTLSIGLEQALLRAQAGGVTVWRSSRWLAGSVIDAAPAAFQSADALTPVQACIELMLQLMTMPAPR